LAYVSHEKNIGKVSGLGVGLGYVGTIVGLLMIKPFVDHFGRQGAFVPTGVLFFIFSLPCIFSTREEEVQKVSFNPKAIFKKSLGRIRETLQKFKKTPSLKIPLIAGLAFFSAVNSTILFMAVYVKKMMGLSEDEIITFFVFSTLFAIGSAFIFGFIVDRLKPFVTFKLTLLFWMVGLLTALLAVNKFMLWVAGAFVGMCLSATWVVSRVLIISLCPKEKLSEIFGLFGFLGKFSSIVGSLVWGFIVFVFDFLGVYKYKIAVSVEVLFILFALWIAVRIDKHMPFISQKYKPHSP
jgi:UMF1 family MFS transporter